MTAQNFTWNGPRQTAAALLAADELTDEDIARRAGISRRQLATWKRHPHFAARVDEISAELSATVIAEGIVRRQNRIDALNTRWRKLQQLIETRAIEHADVPGGDTGLLVRTVKLVKIYEGTADPDDATLASARLSQVIVEYSVDTGLLKEMRELERQAAQELGQWTEKQEHTGELLIREYVGISVEDV